MDAGSLIARQIDAYCKKVLPSPTKLSLEEMVVKGKYHIGRLLHYFQFEKK